MEKGKPLLGLRLLHTRPVDDGDSVAQALLAAGATVLFAPMIRFLPPADPAALRLAVTGAASLILTSPRAVSAVSALVKADTRCFVLTGATQDKARHAGFTLVDVGPASDGEALGKAMVARGDEIPQPCVMPTSDVAQPAVAQVLRAAGVPVTVVEAYQTAPETHVPQDVTQTLQQGGLHAVLCMSPSAVDALVASVDPSWLAVLARVAPGKTTAAALARVGLPATLVAATPDGAAVVDVLSTWWRGPRRPP